METIFVAIPAYRDPECFHTIRDLFQQAAHPHRIRVGVVWQGDESDGPFVPPECRPFVDTYTMHYTEAKGPCFARSIAWQFPALAQASYLLSIDCHMRFVSRWDEEMIRWLKLCPSPKPILTGYPVGFEPQEAAPTETRASLLCASRFDEDGMLRTAGKLLASVTEIPIRSLFWAAGFHFSRASVAQEVPYDPNLPYLFFGEESSMAARLYTHGWDFYTPGRSLCYHQWSRAGRHTFRELPARPAEAAASQQRVRQLLAGAHIQPYGLGTDRTLSDFQRHCGVTFATRTITDRARNGGQPPAVFARDAVDSVLALLAARGLMDGPAVAAGPRPPVPVPAAAPAAAAAVAVLTALPRPPSPSVAMPAPTRPPPPLQPPLPPSLPGAAPVVAAAAGAVLGGTEVTGFGAGGRAVDDMEG